jgi:hypothetical protein
MSLLDQNIQEIIGKEPKHNWKEYVHGIKPNYILEDNTGKNLGKFCESDETKNRYDLEDLDNKIILSIVQTGTFRVNTELRNSENHFLGKIQNKIGWNYDSYLLKNSNDEILLKGKWKSQFSLKNNSLKIQDGDNTIAEWKYEPHEWVLYLYDSSKDRIIVLGFILGVLLMHSGGGGAGGGA